MIFLGFLLICFFILLLVSWLNGKRLRSYFNSSVIVFGKKGTGKDLIFQYVINHSKKAQKDAYYSNLNYGGKFVETNVKDISVNPNTFLTLINGQYTQVSWDFHNKCDIYLSDCGIYLPSQYDGTLDKLFPSFPIAYALSRQLNENNIHLNTQALGRVWLKVREQGEYYIKANKTISIFGYLITFWTAFDRYQSALDDVRPMSGRLFNKFSKAEKDTFYAMHGDIKKGFIIQCKKKIKYDTFAFRYKLTTLLPISKKRRFTLFKKRVKLK
jgi:hypothetical protein